MNIIEPYNDDKLIYNDGKYELTLNYVKSELGNPFEDDGVLQIRIKRNTRKVYEYIFSHANGSNRKTILSIINHTQEYRDYIFDALLSQMEADLASGYNDQALYKPENENDRNAQYLNEVSVATENILYNSTGYGGVNIMFAGAYPLSLVRTFNL